MKEKLTKIKELQNPTIDFPDGKKYYGDIDKMGIRSGLGVLIWPNGSVYEGSFYDNKRHGFGILKFNDGKIYEGLW